MGDKTYVIAEMACSHEGDLPLAKTIVRAAGEAGADAIQFQIWSLPTYAAASHPDYGTLARLEISREAWIELATFSRELFPKMEIVACVSEREGLETARRLRADAYKIHAGDITHHAFLKEVARDGRRIDLSVGACSLGEIESAIHAIREAGPAEIWLMYGFQLFPTQVETLDLKRMLRLEATFGLPVGYQDHSEPESSAAFSLPAAALGMGIFIQEKHLTHDRSRRGIDHQAALNPDEFRRFVAMCREVGAALGAAPRLAFTREEESYRRYASRSLVAARDLKGDAPLEPGDLLALRTPTTGLSPSLSPKLIGRALKRDISRHELIREEDLR